MDKRESWYEGERALLFKIDALELMMYEMITKEELLREQAEHK